VQPLGYVDDNPAFANQHLLGLPVLGTFADICRIDHDALIVAIGNNRTRCNLYERLKASGEHFAIASHPRAIIARDVVIQPGTVICAGVVINPGSVIGRNVIVNTSCSIDHHCRIADHAHIAPGAHLGGDVTIDGGTLIGIGATVMPQRKVGAWSIVGASALVTRDVPAQVTVTGVPAREVIRLH
jgi:sugar O-acyltransferase (sialic acid O-acetyltransferase NeuD family)